MFLSLFRRTVDFITDFYVIVLTPLVMAALLIAVGFARATRNPEKRNSIAYIHGSLLLLLSFLVLPATSMKIFRLLSRRHCLAASAMMVT